MNTFVMIVFIFQIGSISGFFLELFYRHFTDKNKLWYNPGFCVGPWLPIYGIALVLVFLITLLNDIHFIQNIIIRRLILFIFIGLCVTFIELISGVFMLKCFNLRLWDYRNEKFNYKGMICLKYTLIWIGLSAIYYFFIHERIYDSVLWLSQNLIFSFFVGCFFSIFVMDVIYSGNVIAKLRSYAIENNIIVKLEEIKEKINMENKLKNLKPSFFIFMLKENFYKLLKKY